MRSTAMVFLSLGLVVLASGCGSERSPRGVLVPTGTADRPLAESSASSLMGPDGGVLTDGVSVLTIPAGALGNTIWMSLSTSQENGGPVCRISPASLEFAGGAQLSLPLPSGSSGGDTPRVAGYDSTSGSWADFGGAVSLARIQAHIDGSRYVYEIVN